MAPQPVAEAGYKGLMDSDRIVVPGAENKALVFSRRFLPLTAQAKLHEKLYSDVEPEDVKRAPRNGSAGGGEEGRMTGDW